MSSGVAMAIAAALKSGASRMLAIFLSYLPFLQRLTNASRMLALPFPAGVLRKFVNFLYGGYALSGSIFIGLAQAKLPSLSMTSARIHLNDLLLSPNFHVAEVIDLPLSA
jgi:hypothetical protein